MQHPRGVTVILGVGIALGVFVVLIAATMFYGSRSQAPSTNTSSNDNTSITDVVRLACTQTSDCAAYCGLESTYTPYCDSTKHCTCSYSGEPVPSGNANSAVTDFVSCAAAGNPVQESYPRKCSVGGVTFTEVLTNSNVNSTMNTNQSTNTNVSTAGWKTYTNSTYKYSIQYPSDWIVNTSTGPSTIQILPPNYKEVSSIEMTPAVFIKDLKEMLTDELTTNKRDVVIHGVTAKRQMENGFAAYDYTYFPNSGRYISVHWAEMFADEYPQYEAILSTLTFTK